MSASTELKGKILEFLAAKERMEKSLEAHKNAEAQYNHDFANYHRLEQEVGHLKGFFVLEGGRIVACDGTGYPHIGYLTAL